MEPGRKVLHADIVVPDRIMEIGYAFQQSKALLSAVELDVFTVLAERPLDLETFIARTGIHQRGARDFFDSLVALGLLHRDVDGCYSNTPECDCYLVRGKQSYLGDLLRHLNVRLYQNWSLLTQALGTGTPQRGGTGGDGFPALYSDAVTQEVFLSGMTAGSLSAARALATKFPWGRYRTFADIGTAQGCVPVEIASAHAHLRGGGFDLPQVQAAFGQFVSRHRLSDRLQFYAGDFFTDPLPAADVLIMGRILHNWDDPTRAMLLRKAYHALAPHGALIIYDPLIDEERKSARALLSSLNMLLETPGGSEYSAAECTDWMEQAGFREIEIVPLGDVHTAVIGTKKV
jgi:SAM-dependent methyltransferase